VLHGFSVSYGSKVLCCDVSYIFGLCFVFSGMNYTLIRDELIVGSQPQKPEDIDHLKQEQNVAYILNLQQDKDIEYWGIDLDSIVRRCKELGIRHMRRPVRNVSCFCNLLNHMNLSIYQLGFCCLQIC